jgi:hypothetical protein
VSRWQLSDELRHARKYHAAVGRMGIGKYPPAEPTAEPEALGREPLKAAISGARVPNFEGHSLSTDSNGPSQFPKRRFVCGASRDIADIAAPS